MVYVINRQLFIFLDLPCSGARCRIIALIIVSAIGNWINNHLGDYDVGR